MDGNSVNIEVNSDTFLVENNESLFSICYHVQSFFYQSVIVTQL